MSDEELTAIEETLRHHYPQGLKEWLHQAEVAIPGCRRLLAEVERLREENDWLRNTKAALEVERNELVAMRIRLNRKQEEPPTEKVKGSGLEVVEWGPVVTEVP